jgi:GrpB-like predicted nucleotidyltransferase (UPF0157 family)
VSLPLLVSGSYQKNYVAHRLAGTQTRQLCHFVGILAAVFEPQSWGVSSQRFTIVSSRKIEVVDYDTDWPHSFESEKLALEKALYDTEVKIEHIGSTSIPNLAAKPIIDILIEIDKVERLDVKADRFCNLGYEVKGENGIPGRRYYQKGGNNRTHHIHAFQSGSFGLLRHRAFKEYLQAHPLIAREYASIKKQAALSCNKDTERYISMKNDFIVKHEKLALDWYGS